MPTLTPAMIRRARALVIPLLVLALTLGGALSAPVAKAATIVLYQNDFESPIIPVNTSCALDLSQQSVNSLYGPEFKQQNTVETLQIHGPAHIYTDPSGTGGNYALGMLSSVQNDKLALTFDSQGRSFINLRLDISPIDLQACGGPFGVAAPIFNLSLVNSPGGAFSFGSGAVLSSTNITGATPIGPYTFNWTNHVVALSTSGATDGKVTLVIDLLQSGYAALDNIAIVASDASGTSDADFDGVTDLSDSCSGTTLGLGVGGNGCPTVAAIVAASDDPADGGYDQDDLTGMGLVRVIDDNLEDYEAAIANAGPAPATLPELQMIIDSVNPDLPVANPQTVSGSENADLPITLSGTDASNAPLSYTIATLPAAGALFQASAAGTRGAQITSVPAAVSSAGHKVIFAPAANASGSPYTSFNFKVNNGSNDSLNATVTIAIATVDDPPVIKASAGLTVDEGATATIGAAQLAAEDSDSTPAQIIFTLTSLPTSGTLRRSGIALALGGTFTQADIDAGRLTYTHNGAETSGDSFNYSLAGGATGTFAITIHSINDAPVLTSINILAGASEDTPFTISYAMLAAASNVIDPDTASPAFRIQAVSSGTLTKGGVAVTPGVTLLASGESLIWTPAADANGSALNAFTVLAYDGVSASSPAVQVRVAVATINDAPTLNVIADLSVPESAPAQTVNLSGIGAGPANESGQKLTITAISNNPALIPNPIVTYTSPGKTGSLSLKPSAQMIGSAVITVTVTDNGSGILPQVNTFTRAFVVFVGSVNQRPTLDQLASVSVLEDAAAQTISLKGIGAGITNESSQSLIVTAASSDPALIPTPIVTYTSPNATGSLRFAPAANRNGTATIIVRVQDNGGTTSGGIDFVEQTFTVQVAPVNDAPSFTAGPNQASASTAGAQRVAGWATGFTAGPADESGQTLLGYAVVSNSNPALFASAPAVAADGALSYTPVPGASGTATIGVVAHDSGGTADGGADTSAAQSFTITILQIAALDRHIYLPLVAHASAPDLVIASIGVQPNTTRFAAGTPVEVTVTVENRGDGAAGPFWVDLSINPSQPPTAANQQWNKYCALTPCFGLAWYVDSLAPGAQITLTSKQLPAGYSIWPGWFAAGTTDLYAYADTYNPNVAAGAVAERDESNNWLRHGGLLVSGTNRASVRALSLADLRERPLQLAK